MRFIAKYIYSLHRIPSLSRLHYGAMHFQYNNDSNMSIILYPMFWDWLPFQADAPSCCLIVTVKWDPCQGSMRFDNGDVTMSNLISIPPMTQQKGRSVVRFVVQSAELLLATEKQFMWNIMHMAWSCFQEMTKIVSHPLEQDKKAKFWYWYEFWNP